MQLAPDLALRPLHPAPDRALHVFALRAADDAPAALPLEVAAVRIDPARGWRERASFVRRIGGRPGSADHDAEASRRAFRAFLQFVGPEGALLSYGNAGPRLVSDLRRSGLAPALDRRRFVDALGLLRRALEGREAPPPLRGRAALEPPAGTDALAEARRLARALRWLHARGRI